MNRLIHSYLNSFKGLSKEVWWLALITLINRAGTMVIPFLSLYLTQDLGFSLERVGIIMSCFGLGSLCGSWLGGKLTDVYGPYKVMFYSLHLSGLLFILIQFVASFEIVCLAIFILMVVADAFRPATFVALSTYSKPENKTRSVTLIRLAINLGFSAGPAIGGLIIGFLGYDGLFWVDGISCIIAAWLLLAVLNPKKVKILDSTINTSPISAYKDGAYLLFVLTMVIFGFVFVQYFSTIPLFYNEARNLDEAEIGLLLAMNGFLIFVFEMPLIKYLETRAISKIGHMIVGLALVTLSLLVLNLSSWNGVLVIGMLMMTLGEMIAFPFSNAFAMERAKRGNQGEYMALYSIAFSASHIFAHNSGFLSIANFGYSFTWYVASAIGLIGILLLLLLNRVLIKN
ncbi:MFS transporter [Eudoraea chungangensis]|uniref:MFS transporter n=1 Tax=Eudoraea chungangensis TaxID=1481905 RepID=UPI0023EC3140|nr:MFS transporter [Eudoraea chungangensis]